MNFKWLALAAVLVVASPILATDVLTFHNNPARTGLNDHETILTPDNVNQTSFGLLSSLSVDGKVDAQPLYISSVPIRGVGRKNVVVVARNMIQSTPSMPIRLRFFGTLVCWALTKFHRTTGAATR